MQASGKASKNKWMFRLGIILFILFICLGLFTSVLYSPLGRSYILRSLNEAMQESGWRFSAEKIEGSLAEELVIQNLVFTAPQGDQISIDSLKFKISLWRLIQKEVVFKKFEADQIVWTPQEKEAISSGAPRFLEKKLGYTLYFPRLKISNLFLPGQRDQVMDLTGKLRIEKQDRMIYARLYATLPEANGTLLFLKKRDQTAQLKVDAKIISSAFLSSWIDSPINGNGIFHLYAKGAWKAFRGKGDLDGRLLFTGDLQAPHLPQANWSISSLVKFNPQNIFFSKIVAKSDLLNAKGNLSFTGHELTGASLRLSINDLEKWKPGLIQGALVVQGELKNRHARIKLSSFQAKLGFVPLESAVATISLDQNEEEWRGSAAFNALICKKAGEFESLVSWTPSQNRWKFSDVKMNTSLVTASGMMEFPWKGDLLLRSENLNAFSNCDPKWSFSGSASAHIVGHEDLLDIEMKASRFFYQNIKFEEGSLMASLSGSALKPIGRLQGEIQEGRWNNLILNSATFGTEFQDQKWIWNFFSQGEWNAPFELKAEGTVEKRDTETTLSLNQANGVFLSHPLFVPVPIQMIIAPSRIQIPRSEIKIGTGSLQFSFSRQVNETRAKLFCQTLPLNLISANPLEVEVQGNLNLSGEIATIGEQTQGSLNAELNKLLIVTEEPLSASATLNATLSHNRLLFSTDLLVRSKPLLSSKGDIPLRIDLNKMNAELMMFQPVSASLNFNGHVEEVLDFFDLGPNRIEGSCKAEIHLSNVFSDPILSGSLKFHDGRYENYFTGTQLRKIKAEVVAKGDTLHLTSLTAKDGHKKGNLTMNGDLRLRYVDHFPFRFEGNFSRLTVIDTQWAQTDADGDISISGNSSLMRIQGKARVAETEISIPDRIPVLRPSLAVKYLHAPERESVASSRPKSYPIFLDYVIDAPDSIFISGRGLSSEWKGSIVLSGSASQLEMKGKYELMSGNFDFSGRRFKLTEGSLLFGGKPRTFPLLSLAAQIEVQNVSIIANLKGPLNNPLLTLHSSPSLPTGVVLSYLLFDEDLAELDAFQAAQLMTSLSSLSEGTNIVDKTRQALGVDRIRIIATPIDDQGGKSYALQVGKYITRNLLLSVSQGSQGDSTNVGVELNLGHGIIFQAESQQEIEQGKFTLKWNVNY